MLKKSRFFIAIVLIIATLASSVAFADFEGETLTDDIISEGNADMQEPEGEGGEEPITLGAPESDGSASAEPIVIEGESAPDLKVGDIDPATGEAVQNIEEGVMYFDPAIAYLNEEGSVSETQRLLPGREVNAQIKSLYGANASDECASLVYIKKGTGEIPEEAINIGQEDYPVYAYAKGDTLFVYSERAKMDADSSYMFSGMTSLREIDMEIFEKYPEADLSYMLADCALLETKLNTSFTTFATGGQDPFGTTYSKAPAPKRANAFGAQTLADSQIGSVGYAYGYSAWRDSGNTKIRGIVRYKVAHYNTYYIISLTSGVERLAQLNPGYQEPGFNTSVRTSVSSWTSYVKVLVNNYAPGIGWGTEYPIRVNRGYASQSIAVYGWNNGVGNGSSTALTAYAYVTVPPKTNYAVKYNANGGSSTPAAQTKWYDETLLLRPAITKASEVAGTVTSTFDPNGGEPAGRKTVTTNQMTNYAFKNWNTNAAGTGTAYAASASYTGNAALTLYAQWTPSTSYTSGTTPVVTREGYKLLGWSEEEGAVAATYAANASFTPTSSKTYYAIWEPISYNITYNPNGGNGTMAPTACKYDEVATLSPNAFTKENHIFTGWSLRADGNGQTFTDEQEVLNLTKTNGGTVRLFAQWRLDKEPLDITVSETVQITTDAGLNTLASDYIVTNNMLRTLCQIDSVEFSAEGGYTLEDGGLDFTVMELDSNKLSISLVNGGALTDLTLQNIMASVNPQGSYTSGVNAKVSPSSQAKNGLKIATIVTKVSRVE